MHLKTLALAAALTASGGTALAQSSGLAVGANVGTPGLGASLQMQASDHLVLRGDLDWMRIGYDREYSGVDYDGKIKSMTGGVFADYHPGGGGFLISGGVYYGRRQLDLDARPNSDVDIGGQTFTPAQVGVLGGRVKMSKLQPFAGIGYDSTFTSSSGWGFRAIAGVAFSKKPRVDLTATGGTLSNDPAFLSRLAIEEQNVRDDAKKARYFPVVQVGVTRRF